MPTISCRAAIAATLVTSIVPGPVVSAGNVAYVGSDNGVLHALDVATGDQRWSFDGGTLYAIG